MIRVGYDVTNDHSKFTLCTFFSFLEALWQTVKAASIIRLLIRVCALFREKHYILEINKISKAEKTLITIKLFCPLLGHFRNIFLQTVYAQSDLGQYCLPLY